MSLRIIILAAGKGKRMKSEHPKILHKILGVPMINYVLETAGGIKNSGITVVVGNGEDAVRSVINNSKITFVTQEEQLGTGHAVKVALDSIPGFKGDLLILNGDLPAIKSITIGNFIKRHQKSGSACSFISANLDNPKGYGRVIHNEEGDPVRIVEEKDAIPEEKKIREINSGAYIINSEFLRNNINKLKSRNKQGEYYLPEMIDLAAVAGEKTLAYNIEDNEEILGVNNRRELVRIGEIMQKRINDTLMDLGVTIMAPSQTFISPGASIGRDTTIYPNTYIYGNTRIGSNCSIGPSSFISDSKIGNNAFIRFSTYLDSVIINNNVSVGPFAHLRPETEIMENGKIGNFVEIKKSKIGKGSKVPHLSYIGDATLGQNVNIGAGSITCNYDGLNKHRTVIEKGAFIGSDTMMVAPVKIGKDSTTAAGSTITQDVTPGALAIARSKQKEIKDWYKRKKKKDGGK